VWREVTIPPGKQTRLNKVRLNTRLIKMTRREMIRTRYHLANQLADRVAHNFLIYSSLYMDTIDIELST